MAKKTNPKILRIGIREKWNSQWFANLSSQKYKTFLEEDFKIRQYFEGKFGPKSFEKIEIERTGPKLLIIVKTPRPGAFIGRGGKGVEAILKDLQNLLKRKDMKVEIQEVKDVTSNAQVLAHEIAQAIERRVPYRRAAKRAIERAMQNKEVKGIKIRLSGRLDGVEIARPELFTAGRFPLRTLKANIDYGESKAFCTYGVVGVKVWIYKGE
jgi:small subunit ribosomal protein S3